MKRIGFIGLSTPSFYDYAHPASEAATDTRSSPNPIIEGAFGALLLYDELWFLCPSLCPENMRQLPYVKFLTDSELVPDIDIDSLPKPEIMFDASALKAFWESSRDYMATKEKAGIYWDAAADNHTHSLLIGARRLSGNSWSVSSVLYDLAVLEHLRAKNVELITNSFTHRLFTTEAAISARIILTELLILDRVPQYLSPSGPYHPSIEEIRNQQFLNDFRRWIAVDAPIHSPAEVQEVKELVERKLRESQEAVFLKYLDPRGCFETIAGTFAGIGLDALIPGAGALKDLVGTYKDEKDKQRLRWQGFIVAVRQILRNYGS